MPRPFPRTPGADTNTAGLITQTSNGTIQLSNWITLTVANNTVITINGAAATLGDLVYGDAVTAFYSSTNNTATELIVDRAINDPATVYDVATIRGTGTVTDFYPGKGGRWWMRLSGGPFDYLGANMSAPMQNPALQVWPLWMAPSYAVDVRVEPGVVVTVNGTAASMLNIQPGDTVTILMDEIAPGFGTPQGRALFIGIDG